MDDGALQFTQDWFSHNIPVWDRILHQKTPARIVEIGCFEGRSTCYLIDKCAQDHPVDLWCIDPWPGMAEVEQRFDHNVAAARAKAAHPVGFTKIKSRSDIALARLLAAQPPASMDLIYVDGSHQAPDVLCDAVIGFHLLKVGGLMIFDDYLWCEEGPGERDPLRMPKPGIDAFLNIFTRKMRVIANAPIYQLYAQKVAA